MNFKPSLLKIILSILIPYVGIIIIAKSFLGYNTGGAMSLIYLMSSVVGLILLIGIVIVYSVWSLIQEKN